MVLTITVFVEIAPEITNFYLLGNWKLLGNLCSSQNTINSTRYDETNSEREFLKFLQSSQWIPLNAFVVSCPTLTKNLEWYLCDMYRDN